MIKLAIKNNYLFTISILESKDKRIFYTIDTLKKIRKKIGYLKPLFFIIGQDNLELFDTWKDWKKILLLTHLIILPRKCTEKKNIFLKKWINSHMTNNIKLLHYQTAGLIFFSKIPLINISSSQIRDNYFQGKNSSQLLPYAVQQYINLKKLYL